MIRLKWVIIVIKSFLALKFDFKLKWLYTFLFLTNNNFYVWFIWLLQVHNFQKIKWNNPWVFYFISSLTPPLIKLFKHTYIVFENFSLFLSFLILNFFLWFNLFFWNGMRPLLLTSHNWMNEWANEQSQYSV